MSLLKQQQMLDRICELARGWLDEKQLTRIRKLVQLDLENEQVWIKAGAPPHRDGRLVEAAFCAALDELERGSL
jgi:hypothetical protein